MANGEDVAIVAAERRKHGYDSNMRAESRKRRNKDRRAGSGDFSPFTGGRDRE